MDSLKKKTSEDKRFFHEDSSHKTSNFAPHRRVARTSKCKRLFGEMFEILGPLPLDLECLLPIDSPQIWSHIEFDLCGVCVVRQHDGHIAYAASAKLHFLFHLDFAVFNES